MISKTLSGVKFLDEPFGGVYAGRSFLVCGRSGTGKSTIGFQFVFQGLRLDDRCLILSTTPANDLTILAESLGFSFAIPIDLGHLILLEYKTFTPGRSAAEWSALPPEGYDQLREIIEANSIKRIVIDTVLPWVAVPRLDNIAERVFSFVRSFDRLGVTTMMTLPKPVSSTAFRLKKALDDVTPISILLTPTTAPNRYIFQITKYLGEKKQFKEEFYSIERGSGLVPVAAVPAGNPAPAKHTTVQPIEPATPPPPAPRTPADMEPGTVRLSTVVPVASARPAAAPRPPDVDGKVRLANVWKPELTPPTPAPEKI